jgi:hypothetical protein
MFTDGHCAVIHPVLRGMQADGAEVFEHLVTDDGLLPTARRPLEGRKKPRKKTA